MLYIQIKVVFDIHINLDSKDKNKDCFFILLESTKNKFHIEYCLSWQVVNFKDKILYQC